MLKPTELTDEKLCIVFNPSLRRHSAFLGFCLGFLVGIPALVVIEAIDIWLVDLPKGMWLMWTTYAVGSIIGALIGYVLGARYNGQSLTFDHERICYLKDGHTSWEIRWAEITEVKFEFGCSIRSNRGESQHLPNILQSSHESRLLYRELKKYLPPQKLDLRRWTVWGLLMAIFGGIALLSFPKPYQVFADGEPASLSTWLLIAPSLVGSLGLILGVGTLMVALSAFTNRKKLHPFALSDSGLALKGRKLEWDQIARIHRSGAHELVLKIDKTSGGSWMIDCRLYSNGDQLRDAILVHEPLPNSREPSGHDTIEGTTFEVWKAQLGPPIILGSTAIGSFILACGIFAFGWFTDSNGSDKALAVMSLLYFILIFGVLAISMYRIRITSDSVIQSWLLGAKRSVRYSEAERIEVTISQRKSSEFEVTSIIGPNQKVYFSSNFPEYAETRDFILSKVPGDRVKIS